MSAVELRTVEHDEADLRLDRWFKRHFPALGHGALEKLLRTGQVRLDGRRAKSSDRVAAGQVIRVPPLPHARRPSRPAIAVAARDLASFESWILYQDECVIALDKPAGLPVQGGVKSERNLDAILTAAAGRLGGRPLLVHRLDRDTSGVLLLARGPAVAKKLAAAFRHRDAKKLYWAVLVGAPERRRGTIGLPLMKRMGAAGERVVALDDDADVEGARRAVTRYAVIDRASNAVTWMALEPRTGRTHQLRVHMAALGTPILGDGKYGGAAAFLRMPGIARQVHLHARRLRLPHPRRGVIDVTAPPPPYFTATLEALGLSGENADQFVDP